MLYFSKKKNPATDAAELIGKLSNTGTYTTAFGVYTTAVWMTRSNSCIWTAPSDGIYLVWMYFEMRNDTLAKIYKQLQMRGSASRLLGDCGFYSTNFSQGGVSIDVISQPVAATKGQTITPYVHTSKAGMVFAVKIK